MTATLAQTLGLPEVDCYRISFPDGLHPDCDQCAGSDCRNEGQLYYISEHTGRDELRTGSLHCLALLWTRDADRDQTATMEVFTR